MTERAPHPTIARLIVSVEQLDRSLVLYRDVVGLTLSRRVGDLAWLLTSDGVEVMLHQRPTDASETSVSIGFFVDDLDVVVDGWTRGGGRVIDPAAPQPWGERMSVLADVDGHVVCLSERAA